MQRCKQFRTDVRNADQCYVTVQPNTEETYIVPISKSRLMQIASITEVRYFIDYNTLVVDVYGEYSSTNESER